MEGEERHGGVYAKTREEAEAQAYKSRIGTTGCSVCIVVAQTERSWEALSAVWAKKGPSGCC